MEVAKVIRTTRTAADYTYLSDIQHILAKPGMYIGEVAPVMRAAWLLDVSTMKLVYAGITIPPGLIHIMTEVLSNAADNADASRRMGVSPGSIDINMDNHIIRIRNGGEPIPVVQREKNPASTEVDPHVGMWVPGMIFGVLRTSSNYDEKVLRLGCGTNGVGGKVCNIFSSQFQVQVGDPKNGRLYQGCWEKNMSKKVMEEVTDGYTGESFVEVSWVADLDRFSTPEYDIRGGYPEEMFGVVAAAAAGISLTAKIPVTFNGVLLDFRNLRNYLRLFWPEEVCNGAIIHYEWPREILTPAEKRQKKVPKILLPEILQKCSAKEREKIIANPPTPECIPMCEIAIMDTPDAAVTLSFVNAQNTIDGGVHVNTALTAFTKEILDEMNAELKKAVTRGKKDEDEGKKTVPKLTTDDIKPHMSMVLNCRLPDPQYNSQTKTVLTGPAPELNIEPGVVAKIGRWRLTDRLIAVLESKIDSKLKGAEKGRRTKHLHLDRGEDEANEAGGPRSSDCILYLPEGKSAAGYIKKRIARTPGKKDMSGYLPLRGKLPNASSMHKLRMAANRVFDSLKRMWGLQLDRDYSRPEDRATLRYGFLCMAADADADAQHIIALVLEFLNVSYPSLLRCGAVGYLRTPVVRVYRGKNIVHRFVSMVEYERWIETTTPDQRKGLQIKYYKGLAKHNDPDIADDLNTAPVVVVIYDVQAAEALDLAFDKKRADDRKEWIARWRGVTEFEDVCTITVAQSHELFRYQDISQFCRRELVTYMRDSLIRAIPCMFDGLKKSQRQAIYAAIVYWKYGRGKSGPINISRFGNKAAEMTHYHHGEKSICDTITRLGQGFVGSNNMPYFEADGQIGNRDEGGDDAGSSRYVGVSLAWWIKYVYDEELIKMVPLRKEDDEDVEPEWLPAVVPMHVINGALGIATGYSTYMPPHHPIDVVRWLIARCSDKEPRPIKPWFRNFKGRVDIFDPKTKDVVLAEEDVDDESIPKKSEDEDEEEEKAGDTLNDELAVASELVSAGKRSLRTFGMYDILKKTKDGRFDIKITELPIGLWMKPYKSWLTSLVAEGKLKDFHDGGDADYPEYTLIGFQNDKGANHRTLRLQRSFGLGNITLIDTEGFPQHFDNVDEMLEMYYLSMIEVFEANRQCQLKDIQDQIYVMSEKLRYILEVLKYEETRDLPESERQGLWIVGRKKADVFADMDRMKFNRDLLKKVHFSDCTYEEIENIKQDIEKLNSSFTELDAKRPQDLWIAKLEVFQKALEQHKY